MKNLMKLIKKKILCISQGESSFYRIKPYKMVFASCIAFVLGVAASFILTENIIISVFFGMLVAPFVVIRYVKNYRKKVQQKLNESFFELIELVLSMTLAGNSMEESFAEIYQECKNGQASNLSLLAEEINTINRRVKMNYAFLDELYNFSLKTKCRDVIACCEALRITGEKGGNVSEILKNQISNMRIKLETENEIRQTLSGPKYNQKIITVMPFAMVILIKSMSYEYISVLYNTKIGMIIVAVSSVLILIAWILGERLSDIEA